MVFPFEKDGEGREKGWLFEKEKEKEAWRVMAMMRRMPPEMKR